MPMTKGFPRPRKFVKKIQPRHTENIKAYSNDEKWDNKEYPVPYTGQLHKVGQIAYGRLNECVAHRLCIVCGETVEDEKPWAYIWGDKLVSDSGPFHEKCVKLTQTLCPFVNELKREYVFVQLDWEILEKRKLPAGYAVPQT